MATPAITLESLAAGYGDCLLVSCPVGRRIWRLLIDTGPDECLPALTERLQLLPIDASGSRRIDLAVISHIDHDHIGGARAVFADESLKLAFGDVWFNAPRRPTTRGVAGGVGLASVLGDAGRDLPWNRAFDGQDIVTGDSLHSSWRYPASPVSRASHFCRRPVTVSMRCTAYGPRNCRKCVFGPNLRLLL